MKKGLFIAALMLSVMCSCQKEKDVPEVVPESEELVFDITIRHPEDTRAIKSGWVDGDVVFVFFQGVTASNKYLEIKMLNGEWAYTMKNGLKASDLSASGKTLTAVYLPYGNTSVPTYSNTGGWSFSDKDDSYYLSAEQVAYSMSNTSGIQTLAASLDMVNPTERVVQFFIPDASATGTALLACSEVQPLRIASISSNGIITEAAGNQGDFLTGYAATVGSDKGYYFSGSVAQSPYGYPYFALEANGKYYHYYDYSTQKTLSPRKAYKLALANFKEVGVGKFVSIRGRDWSTVSYGAHKPWEYGSRYTWTDAMALTIPGQAVPSYTDYDSLNNGVRNNQHTYTIGGIPGGVWYYGSVGYLFVPFSGYLDANMQESGVGSQGDFWTCTSYDTNRAKYCRFYQYSIINGLSISKNYSLSIRTVRGSATIPVTGVTLDQASVYLHMGSSVTLTADVLPQDASNKNVTWQSSSPSVASVSSSGVVTAVSPGTTTVTVTTVDGNKTASCEVEVGYAVTGLSLDPASLTVVVGSYKTITANVSPANAGRKSVVWESSNTAVATMSGNAVVGVSAGTATITATTVDGGFTATCQVTVVDPVPVSYIRLYSRNLGTEVSSLHMLPNDTDELSIVCYPENATDKDIYLNRSNQYWSSSHTYVSVVYGSIYADDDLRNAQSAVSVSVNGKTATCYVSLLSAGSDAVDLGLSVKWMNRNFYAPSSQGSGVYYTWSEGKNKFHESDSWRLPTKTEMEELVANCTFTPVNGGYTVTGPNNNTIFLPLAGGWVEGMYYPHSSGGGSCYLTSTGTAGNWYRMSFVWNAAPIVDSTPSTGAWSVRLVTTE